MSESGFASLGPSLLARKGGAKPAMRPQVAPLVAPLTGSESGIPEEQLEDLGWNDMGEPEHDSGADIVPISADISAEHLAGGPGPIVRRQQRRLEERVLADAAMTGPEDRDPEYDEDESESDYSSSAYADSYEAAGEYGDESDSAIYSPLAVRPAAIAAAPAPATGPAPAPRGTAKARVPAAQNGRRAAFTLRLDADRHLKLRLAATMQGVSAQTLVTEALDRLLAEYDDLDVIANHLKRH